MVLITINEKGKEPIFGQIFRQLKEMIEKGSLSPGDKLPSTRKMAETLGVHRTTVCRAYDELWAAGYLETQVGGYSRVRQRNSLARNDSNSFEPIFDWESRFSTASSSLNHYSHISPIKDKNMLDFRPLSPDSDLLPVDDYRHCVNLVLKENGNKLLDYGHSLGFEPLRNLLAKQMQLHGISAKPEEIILTNGIQHGLALLLPVLFNPGDTIIVESPSYTKGIWLMKYLNLNIIEVPITFQGIDLDVLEKKLKKHKVKAIYTMPTFQNPTGLSTSQVHREKLLALCEQFQVPLIEDGFEEEMKYFGKAVLPIKSMDRNKLVIYMGTFSKILFPGIRIGWIVASDSLISKLASLKQTTELSGISLTQAAVHQFCDKGFYELHKKRIHRVYRKRMQFALQACREFIDSDKLTYTKPEGGYLIWFVTVDPIIDEDTFIKKLYNAGVAVSPGSHFFATENNQVGFRFSIAHRKEDEIREGIKRIGNVIINL